MVFASGVQVDEACSVNGCGRPVRELGMCAAHYARFKRTGDARRRRMSRACLACGRFFETERKDKAFCSATCRKRFHRLKGKGLNPSRNPNPLKSVLWEPRVNARVEAPRVESEFWSRDDEWASCSHECPVCGRPLDRLVDVLDSSCPVGVWRVPPEKGGALALSNRVLVHRECVSRFESRNGQGDDVEERDVERSGA